LSKQRRECERGERTCSRASDIFTRVQNSRHIFASCSAEARMRYSCRGHCIATWRLGLFASREIIAATVDMNV
jgi:hypothetical protein